MIHYTTKQDLIDSEILPALGEYADDYDIDSLADQVSEYVTAEYPGKPGSEDREKSGFVITASVEEFWEYAMQWEHPGR